MPSIAKSPSSSVTALAQASSRFLAWWGRELAALVPAGLRNWWRESDRIVLVSFTGDQAMFMRPAAETLQTILTVQSGGGEPSAQRAEIGRQLARLVGGNFRVLLCLPADKVLRRTLTLPLAVEENLRQTLIFELDRYTPFKPDQVYLDFRVLNRDVAQRRLTVELAVVRKSTVDPDASRVSALGLPLGGAVLADDLLQGRQYLNFLVATAAARKSAGRLWWRLGLGTAALVLLAGFLAVPLWQKRAAAIGLLAPLGEARTAAQETDALRSRLDQLIEEHNLLPNKKWDSHSALAVLEELSKRLADDTFVSSLDFDGKTVQIQGESASAAGLVEALEASPLFKDVGFKAQLTKIQGTPNDRFHIGALLEDGAKPKPPTAEPAAEGAAAATPVAAAATPATTPAPATAPATAPAATPPAATPPPTPTPPPTATAAPAVAPAPKTPAATQPQAPAAKPAAASAQPAPVAAGKNKAGRSGPATLPPSPEAAKAWSKQ